MDKSEESSFQDMELQPASLEMLQYVEITPTLEAKIRPLDKAEIERLQEMLEWNKQCNLEYTRGGVIPRSGISWGEVYNGTSGNLGVYGPKIGSHSFDNDMYVLESGYYTLDDWDCDGIFVPNDLKVMDSSPSGMGRTWRGPVAYKISNWNILKTRGGSGIGVIEADISPVGVYKSGQINWWIPNEPQSWV